MYIDEHKIRDVLIFIEALLTDPSNQDNKAVLAIQQKIKDLSDVTFNTLACQGCGCIIHANMEHNCFSKYNQYRITFQ